MKINGELITNNIEIREEDYPCFIRTLRNLVRRGCQEELSDYEIETLCGFNISIPASRNKIWLDWDPDMITSTFAPDDDEILKVIAPFVIDGGAVTFHDPDTGEYFGVRYRGRKCYRLLGEITWHEWYEIQ